MATEEEKRAERDFLREVVAFMDGIEHPLDLKEKIARMQCNIMDAQIALQMAEGRVKDKDYESAAMQIIVAKRAMVLGDRREDSPGPHPLRLEGLNEAIELLRTQSRNLHAGEKARGLAYAAQWLDDIYEQSRQSSKG